MGHTRRDFAQRKVELYDYLSIGGGYLGKRTVAWVEHRLAVNRVKWIEKEISVRLINMPGGDPIRVPEAATPATEPTIRAWGQSGLCPHMPLWCRLGDGQ